MAKGDTKGMLWASAKSFSSTATVLELAPISPGNQMYLPNNQYQLTFYDVIRGSYITVFRHGKEAYLA